MLGFYSDSLLTHLITSVTPKVFTLGVGNVNTGSVYLGDPYTCSLLTNANYGASNIIVNDISELLTPGSASIIFPTSTVNISWTSATLLDTGGYVLGGLTWSQTGTGLNAITFLTTGNVLHPKTTWEALSPIVILSQGTDLSAGNLNISLGVPISPVNPSWQTFFGVPGGPCILGTSSVISGVENAVRIDLQLSSPAIITSEYTNWKLVIYSGDFYKINTGSSLPSPNDLTGVLPSFYGYALVNDFSLGQSLRILPENRAISNTLPGFIIGNYRWRDQNTINALPLSPTKWDSDISTIPETSFVSGIGNGTDLQPLGLNFSDNNVYLSIQDGTYFDGPNRFYLPGGKQLDFFSGTVTTLPLSEVPTWPTPVFVGNWKRDDDGFYTVLTSYRYQAGSSFIGTNNQFKLDKSTSPVQVVINNIQTGGTITLGISSGSSVDNFYLPIYPVNTLTSVYYYPSGSSVPTYLSSGDYTFAPNKGQIQITGIVEKYVVIKADYTPAIAVLYEYSDSTREVPVDLNPAFSGISSGYLYLENRDLEPISVVLSCDKPEIIDTSIITTIIPTVSYGPILSSGDYALLSATVNGPLLGETVPDVTMRVLPGDSWSGTLNYQDPSVSPMYITTGANGVVNMIYTPEGYVGSFYIPKTAGTLSPLLGGLKTTNIANDTLVLPELVPYSTIYKKTIWDAVLYTIYNNNPMLGTIGATGQEVPWTTTGTAGTPSYKTNGLIQLPGDVNFDTPGSSMTPTVWNQTPLGVLDENGNSSSSGSFTGNVAAIIYGQSIPDISSIGAYYFVLSKQNISLQLQIEGTSIFSNTLTLQLEANPYLGNDPWLVLDGILNTETPAQLVQGNLDVYHLGY